ncbi:MAG: TerB family tellurite resistance protein [Sandaracinaceae bacterium]|nr:TerB family tellurite resistance protein [Sandaracinaceae bacterium]
MGVFDGFQGSSIQMTPQIGMAAGLFYVAAADGHLSPDERGDILKIVPDDNVLRMGMDFARQNGWPQFLQSVAAVLTPQQKLCMLLNIADMAMGDGHLAPREMQMLNEMQVGFGIDDATVQPYVQALMTKNNLGVFGW